MHNAQIRFIIIQIYYLVNFDRAKITKNILKTYFFLLHNI